MVLALTPLDDAVLCAAGLADEAAQRRRQPRLLDTLPIWRARPALRESKNPARIALVRRLVPIRVRTHLSRSVEAEPLLRRIDE